MADYTFDKLKGLDLSRDEVERIGNALKNEEFRKLFADYVEEIQNPENRKIYEEEIIQLERERGNDAVFLNPQPGYVVKTSADGNKKCFINICTNENVQKPTSSVGFRDGSRGLQWSLPHSLTPVKNDVDNKGIPCQVYDVVFHPDALHMAMKNKPFQNMLTTTACEAIESNFDIKLDKKNLRVPKMQYKGLPQPSIIRKPSKNPQVEPREPGEKELFDKIYAQMDASQQKIPKKKSRKPSEDKSSYTTPTYIIKHRSHVDIQEFRECKDAKMHTAIPKELIVEINLPLLKSSSDITLDVTEKTVQLVSEQPSKYKLNLTLPYRVNQDNGNAKFDKDLKKLIVTLPVKKLQLEYKDDSGVESDHGSPTTSEFCDSDNFVSDERTSFLHENLCYTLPEFTCHLFENVLAFTLNVKHVDTASIEKLAEECSVHVKFTSISSSFYTSHYAIYIKLPCEINDVEVEAWDNNVVVQIPFNCDNALEYYFCGLKETELKQKYIEEPSILNSVLLGEPIPEEPEFEQKSEAINIVGASESSGDELSYSYSPSRGRGILKRLSNGGSVGRSISESSLDDFCSSFDSAIIQEDQDLSASLKKTVRFNDVIMRQLYRSNSSILGQKKKNQRKARNKKRAQERRYSESEASEVEDKAKENEDIEPLCDLFVMDL